MRAFFVGASLLANPANAGHECGLRGFASKLAPTNNRTLAAFGYSAINQSNRQFPSLCANVLASHGS
ncbi:hypothetical protein, partial [Pseudomonas viridiflava]|uniref:hypothetical protein n=1 Tax=Pseudomonas viridiflava TaxID=33069 RepID=UPI001980526A